MSVVQFQNLTKPFTLSKSEDLFLRQILKLAGHESWDKDLSAHAASLPANYNNIRQGIKNKIKAYLEVHQNHYCVYCGIHLDIVGTSDREHIANKARYPDFTYVRHNIVLSCIYCNRSKKGQKNTIATYNRKYSNCSFKIIHPYFDKFEQHIEGSLNDSLLFFSPVNNSIKGAASIKMFRLMNVKQAELRGNAVVAAMWKQGILPTYVPNMKLAINSSYIM